MPVDGANGPLAALGVSSAAGSFGQASISQYRARRDNVRDVQRVFSGLGQAASIELRFVLARPQATSAQLQAVAEEQRRYQDMVYLNITESRFNCALKFLLWFAHCQTAFPSARFYAIADDDTFIQLAHFEADLRTIPAAGYVVWGLVMWSVKHCRKRCPNESGTWGSDRAATAACASPSPCTHAGTHSTTTSRWSRIMIGPAGSTPTPALSRRADTLRAAANRGAPVVVPPPAPGR